MHKFFIKLVFFVIIVAELQFYITQLYPPSLPDHVPEVQAVVAKQPDVLYLGDSTSTYIHPTDTDTRTLGEMVQSFLPGYRLGILAYPASNPEVYLAESFYADKHSKKIEALVIPINMRVFSQEWDSRPVFQFVYSKASLSYYDTPVYPFLRFLITIKAIDLNPISQEEFDNTLIYSGNTAIGKLIDFESIKYLPYSDDNMRRIINYFYMSDLQPNNRQLLALVKLSDMMKDKSMKLFFYLTPIDYQTGNKFLGDQFTKQLKTNTNVIKTVLAKHGVTVLDLSFSLGSSYFGWKGSQYMYINEHLNNTGRLWLAEHIASEVRNLLQKN